MTDRHAIAADATLREVLDQAEELNAPALGRLIHLVGLVAQLPGLNAEDLAACNRFAEVVACQLVLAARTDR